MSTEINTEVKETEVIETIETGETLASEGSTQGAETAESTKEPVKKEKTFTQEELNEIISKRNKTSEERIAALEAKYAETEKKASDLLTKAKKKEFTALIESPKLFEKFKDEIEIGEDGSTNIKQLAEDYGLPMKSVKLKPTHSETVKVDGKSSLDLKSLGVMHGVRI